MNRSAILERKAKNLRALLPEINKGVDQNGGKLPVDLSASFKTRYRDILKQGNIECPSPDERSRKKGKRGRLKRSKARNLLERMRNYEQETLRVMDDPLVPFTNNRGENDIRMTKVHQKISGCFRSMDGARMFCRIHSYLSTCKKNQVHASETLCLLLGGELPSFLSKY